MVTADQLNNGAVLTLVAAFCGVRRFGLGKVESVVKGKVLPVDIPALLLASIRK